MLIQGLVIWMAIFEFGTSDEIESYRSVFLPPLFLSSSKLNVLKSIGRIVTPDTNCPKCACGVAENYKRIVGGKGTDINKYPWMTMLLYNNLFYCGGSLINDRYVLTAAHCVKNIPIEFISVGFLTNGIYGYKNLTRKAQKIKVHPNFNVANLSNDIALIQLDQQINFRDNFRPVCLASGSKSYAGSIGIVTGWGATSERGVPSNNLNEVSLPIMSNSECRKTRPISVNMICAGYKKGQKDACQGDSGGPMHVTENQKYYQVGIVSWGKGCARPNNPGVYTRISKYNNWIIANTRDACFCD